MSGAAPIHPPEPSRPAPAASPDALQVPTLKERAAVVAALRAGTLDAARPEMVDAQHSRGRYTARERIARLVDSGTFVESGQLARPDTSSALMADVDAPADGVVIGTAEIDGRPVVLVSYDFSVLGGSMGYVNDVKFGRARQIALRSGIPLVMLVEGAGARINERMGSGTIKGHERFSDLSLLSGWAPIVAGIAGRAFAGHANLIALSDFCVMTKGSSAGLAGPRLVEMATGERLTPEEIGDSTTHAATLGSVELEVADEDAMLAAIRDYLSYLPTNALGTPPALPEPERGTDTRLSDDLLALVPSQPQRAYDMRRLVRMVLDDDTCFELRPTFARNVITALGRIGGHPVGVIANNPMFLAGSIDTPGSHKMARFINICDAFGLPLVFLADVPGYLVGRASEAGGIVRASMRPLWELGQSTVPILTVVVRKAYGLAYHTMGGAEFHPELMVCWPGAQISPMGAEGAANVILGSRGAVDPVRFDALVAEFKALEDPVRAAEQAKIDDVIDPRDTRTVLLDKLRLLSLTRHDSGHWRPPKKRGISPI